MIATAPVFAALDSGARKELASRRAQKRIAPIPRVMAGKGSGALEEQMLHDSSGRASVCAGAPWTVSSWNSRALAARADERVVYEGGDRSEAIRIFAGLSRWKRRGIVEMVCPHGHVSTTCKAEKKSWATDFAHRCQP